MATAVQQQPYGGGGGGYVSRSSSSGLYDVLELILDKGLVIDVFVRVSLIGIEILTIDARIVIASVDTYLRFAEAVNRLDLMESSDSQGLPDMMHGLSEGGASSKTKGVLHGAKEALFGDDEDEDEKDDEDDGGSTRRRSSTSTTTKRRRRSESTGSGSGRGRSGSRS
jgi:gas vesicle structural protein